MLEKFLKIVESGYEVRFDMERIDGALQIRVSKNDAVASQYVNLNHAEDFGLPKDIVIMATIEKLMRDLEE